MSPRFSVIIGVLMCAALFSALPVQALEAGEVLVVVNATVGSGVELAGHYMARRGVPKENLVRVSVADAETISRRDYEEKILRPVRRALKDSRRGRTIRCLLLMHGMPLRVKAPAVGAEENKLIAELQQLRDDTRRRADALPAAAGEEKDRLQKAVSALDVDIRRIRKDDHSAAVDSELALAAAGDYMLAGWVLNPLFIGGAQAAPAVDPARVLLVSRLDAPDASIVRRVIDESIQAERHGLSGRAYFDARWPKPAAEPKGGYEFYDAAIHNAAAIVSASGRMPVTLESTGRLFQPGECPEAALYCGWYSLGQYVGAFSWVPGAIGCHIASSECATLRLAGSQVWCKRMLEEGAAAVIGPVDEPYAQAFPLPDLFFGLLIAGRLTLAECYFAATPWLSWRMVLVGDPLYRPFAAREQKPPVN